MSEEEQKWTSNVQIGFGDEIGHETLNDYWPSSTQSPGLSPQPSPDSQLLESAPASSDASSLIQTSVKNPQTPAYTSQPSSITSQPTLPQNKQNVHYSQSQHLPNNPIQQTSEGQNVQKAKAVFQPSNTSGPTNNRPQPTPHPAAAFHGVPHKAQNKVFPSQNVTQSTNVHGMPAQNINLQHQHSIPAHNVNQNTNAQHQQHNVRIVRPPSMGQHSMRPQGFGNAQEPRHGMRGPTPQAPGHSKAGAMPTHAVHPGQKQQPQQPFHPQPQNIRQPQMSSSSSPQSGGQLRPNVQVGQMTNAPTGSSPRAMAHNQYVPNTRPPMGHGPPNPRMSQPGQPNPRMRMGDHAAAGRMVRPPHPTNAGPRMGGPRFPGQNPHQARPPLQGPHAQHNMAGQETYPYYDDEEDDEDMDYDEEDEDDDEIDKMYGNGPYGDEYDTDDSEENSSDEEHMLLTEYIECTDDAQAEYLYDHLIARGVPAEEIQEFKDNCMRQRNPDDMYYDEDMDDDDDDDDYDEEMVSSSTSMNNTMGRIPPPQQTYRGQPGGARVRPQGKDGPPPSRMNQPPFYHPREDGMPSGPRLQGSPRKPPPQRFPVPPQRKPAPAHPPNSAGPAIPQGGQAPQQSPQPRLPSPVKSQNPGMAAVQGVSNQRQGPMPSAQTSPSSNESQNFNPHQSSPLYPPQQTSTTTATGQMTPRGPAPQSSAAQTSNTSIPSSSPSQPANVGHVATAQVHPQASRAPAPQAGSAGSSTQSDGANYGHGRLGTATMRPVVHKHPMPRQHHRFPQAQLVSGQTYTATYHGNPRMQQSHPRLKTALMGGKVPSEAHLARRAVLEMQQSLDQEIMVKKGLLPPNQMSPHQHLRGASNQFAGRPRFQNTAMAGSHQFFRHQLPPRTPFPRTHDPRPARVETARPVCSVPPFTSHTPQQAAPPNPRPPLQGNVGGSPRPQNAAQYPPNFVQPTANQNNRMNVPVTSQQTVTMSSVGMRGPAPRNGPQPQGQGQVASTQEAPFDQQKQAQISPGQSQPQVQCVPPAQQPQSQQQQQHQPQQTPAKSESFNLCSLSEDKFIIKGTPRLVTNTVYQIKSPVDNSSKLARWNGERFEDLEPCGEKSTSSAPKASAVDQAPPQVSTQNLEPSTSSQAPVNPPQVRNDSRGNTEPSQNQATYVKPLTEDNNKPNPPDEENEDEHIFKKPLNDDEEHFRVCDYCGYTSKNFKRCEGCKRLFKGEVKIHVQKKKAQPGNAASSSSASSSSASSSSSSSSSSVAASTNPSNAANKTVSKLANERADPAKEVTANRRGGRGRPTRGMPGRTRGGGMRGQMGGRKGQDDYDSSDSEDSVDKQISNIPPEAPLKRKVGRGRARNAAPRKRSKKIDEPVTVMISSDEDEPSSTSNTPQGTGPPPSPVNSAGSESPIFPGGHVAPPSTYGRFRRMFMEDEQGNSKISKKLQQQALSARGLDDEDFDEDEDDEDGDEPPTYEIEIRSIRVGSMRTKPEGPLFINMRGVCFRVRSERTEEAFECEIMSQEVEFVKYFGGQSPVLFFLITPECGEKLRDIFRMEEGGDEYLDPSSTDLKQKMVVIIVESSNYLPQDMRETLSLWADINHVDDSDFIEELSEESANDLLIQSAPAVLTADLEHDMVSFKKTYMRTEKSLTVMPRGSGSPSRPSDNEPDSTSSSPPQPTELRHYLDGPPIRLLQYPPLPARGIPITTEDLFCLHEGEFLNDVIIDFYLQYLHQEKITEDLKQRTHIFSSFFYKRLTQRDRHSEKTEEDAKKSLPERRHARVKKWTKTVDLFSKDFIIVPINENSHWYLAVVCFPGLASPEVVPYIPSTAHREEVENDNNSDTEPSEEGTSEEKPPAPEPPAKVRKTILGKSVDPKLCLNNDDVKYSFGQKSPCILMFDSLAGPSRTPNVKMLREYLQCEWNAKKEEPRMISKLLKGSTPKVPQQSNFSDCGVYLLQYVESFFEDPIADFQIPMKGLQDWFSEKLIMTKRQEIHELIMRLHCRHQEQRGDPKILDIKYESGYPREDPPQPPFPHPDHHHPPPPPPHHLHPHAPPPHHPHHPHHIPPPPQDDQQWQAHHHGYQEPADNGGVPVCHQGELDLNTFMDSGDSSNSGSMGDSEEQHFLYSSSQDSVNKNEEPSVSFRQEAINSFSQESDMADDSDTINHNAGGSGSFFDDATNQNQNQNQTPSFDHPGDFLSQPSSEQSQGEDSGSSQGESSVNEPQPLANSFGSHQRTECVENSSPSLNSTPLSGNDDSQEAVPENVDKGSSLGGSESQ